MKQATEQSGSSSRSHGEWAGRMFVYVLLLFIAGFLGITYWNARRQRDDLRHQYERYRKELREVRRSNRVLAEKNRRLKQDPQAIERILREEYHLLRPDEYRIISDR